MPRSRHRTATLLAVVLAAAFAATGCSAGQGGGEPAAGLAPGATAVREPADPSGWTLPLMAYRPTAQQRRALVTAEQSLVRSCMKDFGLRWAPPAELPVVGPRNDMDWRYGIHDAKRAAVRGFQPDAAQLARYQEALRTGDAAPRRSPDVDVVLGGSDLPADMSAAAGPEVRAGVFHGRRIPAGGCFGQARKRLGTSTYGTTPLASALAGRSYPGSLEDPAVKAVFARWSACMKGKGFGYADPPALFDDVRFGRQPHPVTRLETSTALADLDCRAAFRVTEVWHAAESRVQREAVRANRAKLDAERRTLDAAVRAATEVLAAQ